MLKLDFISARGDVLPLANNPLFALYADGITAASASIASTENGGDGDTVNNIKATPRSIVIDLTIRGGVNVEYAKREITKVIKFKQKGALVWTQDGRTLTISGYADEITMPRSTNAVVMQIALHCEQPFWEDVDDVVQQINEAINLHYFTTDPAGMLYFPVEGIPLGEYDTNRAKSFFNAGDVSCGLELSLLAHETVTNPIIYDGHGNYFGLGYAENPFVMKVGDYVVITTHKGNKRVVHNGVDVYDKIKPNSKWLQLETGDNAFAVDSDDISTSNLSFSIIYKQRYI